MQPHDAIAIIGMGAIFPKAIGLKHYWHLIFNGIDAITDIPEESHWRLQDYFDKDPSTPDHTYCQRGGFLPKVNFDPTRYGFPPTNLEATDTSQLLGLMVAEMALEDAGYPAASSRFTKSLKRRTNVILGVTGTQELVIPLGGRLYHPHWKKALEDAGIPPEKQNEILERISDQFPKWQENSFPGLLGNVVAGRIANRLDLGGTNTVVDAACASSLSAVHTACLELQSGRCDMSITGGVDTLNDIFMHMCFSKTGVLSHTSDAKPFSKDADGTVLGEGIGMVVLKRLADAKKDDDRIYAVIKGIGTSSDGKTGGIYAPDSMGQLRALKAAYEDAGIDPLTVELFEAHGTGTRVGDKIEFSALKALLSENPPPLSLDAEANALQRETEHQKTSQENNEISLVGKGTEKALQSVQKKMPPVAIGSVKSMIGHAKAAAGIAGLIKSALSLHHKVIPPTLKAETPDPALEIEQSSLYLNALTKPWSAHASHLRRSGVSAFGFGGSNFHIVLEEAAPSKTEVSWDGSVQILAFSSQTKEGLLQAVEKFKACLIPESHPTESHATLIPQAPMSASKNKKNGADAWAAGKLTLDELERSQHLSWHAAETRKQFNASDPFRVLMSVNAIDKTIVTCEKIALFLASNEATDNGVFIDEKERTGFEKEGIFFGTGKREGKIAFLFPGQGSQYTGMGRELMALFPEAVDTLTLAEKEICFGKDPILSSIPLAEAIYPLPPYAVDPKGAEETLRRTDVAQPAIGAVSLAMAKILKRFGITPDAVCGHSFGELTALCTAGRLSDTAFFKLAGYRGKYMADAAHQGEDSGSMLAVKAPLEKIEKLIVDESLDLVLANRNSPDQGVLSGPSKEIDKGAKACKREKMRAVKLPVAAAFHSKLVKQAAKPFGKVVEKINRSSTGMQAVPNGIPVMANSTGKAYPDNSDKAAQLLSEQLSRPVDFVANIETLLEMGVTTFIEVGPKTVLTGLTRSIVHHRANVTHRANEKRDGSACTEIVTLAMDSSNGKNRGIDDLASLICALGALGVPVSLEEWEIQGDKPVSKKMRVPLTGANVKPKQKAFIPKTPSASTKPPTLKSADKIKQNTPEIFEQNVIRDEALKPTSPQNTKEIPSLETPSQTNNSPFIPSPKGMDMSTSKSTSHTPPPTNWTTPWTPQQNGMASEQTETATHHQPQTTQPADPNLITHAMQLVHQGMLSMQELQARTAQAHERFLETQTTAGHTLQAMMEQTRFFAQHAIQGSIASPMSQNQGASPQPSSRYLDHSVAPLSNPSTSIQSLSPPPNHGTQSPSFPQQSTPQPNRNNGSSLPSGFDTGNVYNPYRHHGNNGEAPAPNENTAKILPNGEAPVSNENTAKILLDTVSKLTGFPPEMLTLDMNIESDLGIDSIKRVEIVSELEKAIPGTDALTPENMGTLKTLKDIVDAISPGNSENEAFPSNQTAQTTMRAHATQTTQTPTTQAPHATQAPHTTQTTHTDQSTQTAAHLVDTISSPGNVMEILMETISALTGFPTEMLTPEMDLESDLGIDSIKRVEILSTLEQKLPEAATLSPDELGQLKTLEEIARKISGDAASPETANDAKQTTPQQMTEPTRSFKTVGPALSSERESETETETEGDSKKNS